MDIVMTITTKLLVTLIMVIAALVAILTGTNIASNVIVKLVKTKRKRRNAKSGRRRANAAKMPLL